MVCYFVEDLFLYQLVAVMIPCLHLELEVTTHKVVRRLSASPSRTTRTSRSFPTLRSVGESTVESTGMINLHTIPLSELEAIVVSWGHPKYRAKQVYHFVHGLGITDVTKMNNIPKVSMTSRGL